MSNNYDPAGILTAACASPLTLAAEDVFIAWLISLPQEQDVYQTANQAMRELTQANTAPATKLRWRLIELLAEVNQPSAQVFGSRRCRRRVQ